MRYLLWLLFTGVTLLLPFPAIAFCKVPQPRLVCAEYFASQLVVEATLVRTGQLRDKDDPEGISAYVYTLRVNRALRGKVVGTIRVYEGNDSGRATFDWVPGRQYLLFLLYSASEKSWELDGCGNSGPLNAAAMALSEIAAIKASRGGGVIHGVVSERALSAPISGAHVEALGATGRYATTTNEKDEFQFNVPAGRYIVRAAENEFAFETADISYEDPRNIQIEPGGCAQVQLVKVGLPPAR
jgi:hypothetical protein